MDKARQDQLLELLHTHTVYDALKLMGLSRAQVARARASDREFHAALSIAEQECAKHLLEQCVNIADAAANPRAVGQSDDSYIFPDAVKAAQLRISARKLYADAIKSDQSARQDDIRITVEKGGLD